MKFNQLSLTDYQRLKPYFRNLCYELCEYSLNTLLAWTTDEFKPRWTLAGEALLIGAEYPNLVEDRHLFMPVSPGVQFNPSRLYDIARETGYEVYCFVPESYFDMFPKAEVMHYFRVIEQREYADYIYRKDDLEFLPGNKYSKKRNLVHQFMRSHVEPGRVVIEEIRSGHIKACISFVEEWCKMRDCEPEKNFSLACEKQAAINAIRSIELLETKGILLRIDGRVSAIGISSPLTDNMGILHFEKAFDSVKGLYQYFDKECIKQLFSGYEYVNKESDMNDPGLAKSKRSYHPVKMVRSFKLVKREI